MITQIPNELFIAFFQPGIRVLFNWDRLKHEKWPIRMDITDQVDELSGWYVPWYLGNHIQEVSYSDPDAKPLRLSESIENLTYLNRDRQELILSLSRFYETARQPVQLIVPIYALNPKERIVLDSNHRLAALLFSKANFVLMTFTIFGPLDIDILPDLKHWI